MNFIRIIACCLLSVCSLVNAQDLLQKNMSATGQNQQAGHASQQKIDALYEQQQDALQDYRLSQAEIDQLSIYNRQLTQIIGNQDKQVASLRAQIKEIEVTQQGIMPLMERMLNGLQTFIELDTPFLLKEREARIAGLRVLLLSAEITVSEKFRRVLEAYQIEVEYGRTIEAYRSQNHRQEMVNFLRVGRVALYYLPLDGSNGFVWDKNRQQWLALASEYDRVILQGIRIARKQSAPSLLSLQLPGLGVNP
ncbi:MAG: DUF3450 domain-containing protein [Bermanella sp.]